MAQATGDDYSLHDDVLERGTLFAVLFYFHVTAFILTLAGGLVQALAETDIFALGYAAVFGGLCFYMLHKQDLYGMLAVASLPVYTLILTFFLLTIPSIASSWAGITGTYALTAVGALLLGGVPAYMFHDTAPDIFRYLTVSMYGSSVVAVAAGATQAVILTVDGMGGFQSVPRITFSNSEIALTSLGSTNAALLFSIILILFNAPFLWYSRDLEDFDIRYTALYLIPVMLYTVAWFFTSSILQTAVI